MLPSQPMYRMGAPQFASWGSVVSSEAHLELWPCLGRSSVILSVGQRSEPPSPISKCASYDPAFKGRLRVSVLGGLSIRSTRRSDLREAAGIAAEREGESPEKWLAVFECWHEEGASGQSLLLVAALRERVIGYGRAQYFVPPEDSPCNVAPEGWYLMGVVIHPAFRRRGVGLELTRARLAVLAQRCWKVFYFANERNLASIELHRSVGFIELTRDFWFPKVQFEGGVGVLFECDLRDKAWPNTESEGNRQ